MNGEYIPRPIVLNVILLDLLHMMVALRVVHPLCVLPRQISDQAQRGEYQAAHEPELGAGEQDW